MGRLTEREPYWLGEEFWTYAMEPTDEEIEEVFPIEISTIHISDMGNGEKVFQFDGAFYNSDGDVEFDYEFDLEDFGETIFLTMEEAEKKLRNRMCEEM